MAEVPKVVSQRLRAITKLEDHPDANLLSAFVVSSLGRRERIQILEHLSQCRNCREIVALSAAESPTADVSAIPSRPGWLSWPVLRWGALVACVVVVGAVVTLRQKPDEQQIVGSTAGGNPAVETQLPASNGTVERKVASLQVPRSETKVAPLEKQPTSPATAASPVEIADARSPFTGVVPGRAKNTSAESQDADSEKAVGGLEKKRSMATPAGATSLMSNALIPANLIPRWTLSSDGTLQRSLDSGRSWQTIQVSSDPVFRALAANGLDIWVGGSGGALFHSSNAGEHWTQIRPVADSETLEDDIIGVEFTDTLHGKLTTSSEETWITADAGQTWQKQ